MEQGFAILHSLIDQPIHLLNLIENKQKVNCAPDIMTSIKLASCLHSMKICTHTPIPLLVLFHFHTTVCQSFYYHQLFASAFIYLSIYIYTYIYNINMYMNIYFPLFKPTISHIYIYIYISLSILATMITIIIYHCSLLKMFCISMFSH